MSTITAPARAGTTVGPVLGAISFCHLLNDMTQSLLPAIYPILKGGFNLDFGQIGLLTLTYQITASLLQPLVGLMTDRWPQPYSLAVGMGFTLLGLVGLSVALSFGLLLAGAALLGIGSSIFHPEASRIARLASGGRHGLAQSMFQVGGNFGSSLGPLLAAFIILPMGRGSLAWFALAAFTGIVILTALGRWSSSHGHAKRVVREKPLAHAFLSKRRVTSAFVILMTLVFSKYFYLASFTSYYIFYLMNRFHLPLQAAQIDLFVFLGASAVGTLAGGPIGDRIGRKRVIWGSIVGVAPFALALPHCGLAATIGLTVIIGLVISSAFSAIVVYAQELLPGRVGMVSGLFFGFAFGMGGIGAAVLGQLADWTSITLVYRLCSFLPLIGLLTALLPDLERKAVQTGV